MPKGAWRFSAKTRLAYYTDCEALYNEAYYNYSKKGFPVMVPGLCTRAELMLPPNSFRWGQSVGDEVLSSEHAQADSPWGHDEPFDYLQAMMRFAQRKRPDELTTEDGIVLPKGTSTSYFTFNPQTDPDAFEDPLEYNPFRFSKMREDATATGKKMVPVSFVSTSMDHLAFGHGNNSFPGAL
ncbi:hypothetical protein B0H67DRAFT_641651 [Lasiosphaeris hirsuta]|uniref:Uncharacterized protein n=1 Tax=Lasiosphaeris hirsuta TaxID=260670 RepID=A0AA40B027_9PEZI|nr:hypothetical protein B0H67DRAFT_641651 [Lasiosphaeris hirsuta]